jgi:lipopolysaccharide export system protein LptC
LGRWCIKQRSDYKNNAIKIERYELLVDIGFEFRDEGGPDVTIGGKKKVLTKEDRQIELLKKCREALAKTGEENKRLTADNKRKAEQIREQADTIKRLKATIRALASD